MTVCRIRISSLHHSRCNCRRRGAEAAALHAAKPTPTRGRDASGGDNGGGGEEGPTVAVLVAHHDTLDLLLREVMATMMMMMLVMMMMTMMMMMIHGTVDLLLREVVLDKWRSPRVGVLAALSWCGACLVVGGLVTVVSQCGAAHNRAVRNEWCPNAQRVVYIALAAARRTTRVIGLSLDHSE